MLAYPNYDKSVLSIVSSVKNFFRTNYVYNTLPVLDEELNKGYKNVVIFALNGLGTNMLEDNVSKGDILRKNNVCSVSSVYPTATTASDMSFLSGLSPAEHGWIGSSLYFKEYSRMLDVVKNTDAYSRQSLSRLGIGEYVMPFVLAGDDIFIDNEERVQPFVISKNLPAFLDTKTIYKYADDFDRVCELVTAICRSQQKTYTFVEWNAIKDMAQVNGCRCHELSSLIKSIGFEIGKLKDKLQDTLIIVSSGHGMTDISEDIVFNSQRELMEFVTIPPFVENRAISFFVRSDKRTDFERVFTNMFSRDFMLMSRYDFMNKGILGRGNIHIKTEDFIGDFFACAIGDKCITFKSPIEKPKTAVKASCGGLTQDEIYVPVIVLKTKQNGKYKRGHFEHILPLT